MRFGPVCPQTGDRSASFPRYAVTSAPRAITVKSGRCHVCMVIHSFARPHPENSTCAFFSLYGASFGREIQTCQGKIRSPLGPDSCSAERTYAPLSVHRHTGNQEE